MPPSASLSAAPSWLVLGRSANSRRRWRGSRSLPREGDTFTTPRPPAILLIESNDDVALALEEALENAQFNVECVASVAEAWLFLSDYHFDMVVLTSESDGNTRAELSDFVRSLPRGIGYYRSPVIAVAAREGAGPLDDEARALGIRTFGDPSQSAAELVETVRAALGANGPNQLS